MCKTPSELERKPYKVKMPLSLDLLSITTRTLDILVCREACNHCLTLDEPCLKESLSNSHCVTFPISILMDLSYSHSGTEEQREICPAPPSPCAMLQFEAVIITIFIHFIAGSNPGLVTLSLWEDFSHIFSSSYWPETL